MEDAVSGSSTETERQNPGGLLEILFREPLGLFESAAGTVRSCSALAGTPADLATDEAAAHRLFDFERGEKRTARQAQHDRIRHKGIARYRPAAPWNRAMPFLELVQVLASGQERKESVREHGIHSGRSGA
jgi:hypothetical protein